MSTSAVKFDATAIDVRVTNDHLLVVLADGRELAAPLAWFPRLLEATENQRNNWRLIGRGQDQAGCLAVDLRLFHEGLAAVGLQHVMRLRIAHLVQGQPCAADAA